MAVKDCERIPITSPQAFVAYVKQSAFDPESVRDWERETLSFYLNIKESDRHKQPGDRPPFTLKNSDAR